MNTLILKNATIIDGTGNTPVANGSVIAEGERIKEVLAGPPGKVPSKATVIDCRHQTLLPGLIDAHVHVGAVEANIMTQQRRFHTSMLVIRSLKVIKETLDHLGQQGCRTVFLEVRASHAGVIGFYEQAGFRVIQVRKCYYVSPIDDAAIMELRFNK